jgi:hypothetical protein
MASALGASISCTLRTTAAGRRGPLDLQPAGLDHEKVQDVVDDRDQVPARQFGHAQRTVHRRINQVVAPATPQWPKYWHDCGYGLGLILVNPRNTPCYSEIARWRQLRDQNLVTVAFLAGARTR